MDVVVPLIIIGALGCFALYACSRMVAASERSWLYRILLYSFGVRLAAATVFALIPETRVFHDDATGYEIFGMLIARGWKGEGPPFNLAAATTQNYGFYYVSAAVYYLVGQFQPAVSYFSSLVGAGTVFLVYRLSRDFFHPLVARRAAVLTAFYPSMILWSSMAIKDPTMSLLILLSLSSCVALKRRFGLFALLGTVLPVVAMQPIRFYMVYFMVFAILASLLFERGIKRFTGISKQLVIGGSLVLLLLLVGLTGRTQEGVDQLSLERVSSFRRGMAVSANSGFATSVDISTPGNAIAFLPIGMSVLLLSPFPWQFTSLRALLAAPETILWWTLFPSLIRGIRFAVKERFAETSPVLLFSITLTSAYSLMHGNVGSGFRQRAQIFVVLFIFTSLGVYMKKCRKHGIDPQELLEGPTSTSAVTKQRTARRVRNAA